MLRLRVDNLDPGFHRDIANVWNTATRSRAHQHPAGNAEDAVARDIPNLPALASEVLADTMEPFGWGPTLKVLLAGIHDPSSPLRALHGLDAEIVPHIYSYIASEWAKHVTLTLPASCVGRLRHEPHNLCVFPRGRSYPFFGKRHPMRGTNTPVVLPEQSSRVGHVAWASCGTVQFPPPANRNVNMMPFVFGNKASLPEDLQCYYDSCIEMCPYMQEEVGKVGYLTVHESFVEANDAQRRQGLHIESPGVFSDDETKFSPALEHSWGCGVFYEPDKFQGGIYMASSVADTSQVWDALVDKRVPGIVDRHGGCEDLRGLIRGVGTKLAANQLIWMTDCTPHEAIPQNKAGHRQFFRVVTSHVSHWFADHSTPNPRVPLPDNVTVIHGSKFD